VTILMFPKFQFSMDNIVITHPLNEIIINISFNCLRYVYPIKDNVVQRGDVYENLYSPLMVDKSTKI